MRDGSWVIADLVGKRNKTRTVTVPVWVKPAFEISPHDLRRTYVKLAHKNGAKIDKIQLNLGHHSLATTQVYLGNELDLKKDPGDFLDINIE